MHKYSVGLSVAGAIAIAGFSACGSTSETAGNDNFQQTTGDGGRDGGDGGDAGACTPTQLFSCSEGQIAAIASAANEGEIAQAQFAASNAQSSQVRDFANVLVTDHTTLQREGMAAVSARGIQPMDNAISITITLEAQAGVTILRNATTGQNNTPSADAGADAGADPPSLTLDETFVSQQILSNLSTLSLLDQVLIPSTSDTQLKTALMDARARVADHLSRALALEKSLVGDSCGGNFASDAGTDGGAANVRDAGAADSGKDSGMGSGQDSGAANVVDSGASNPWM